MAFIDRYKSSKIGLFSGGVMSGGPQLVYGDGWDDIKDCFNIGGLGKLGRSTRTSHSSRGSYYGNHPHSNSGYRGYGRDGSCADCFDDFGDGCSKKRFGVIIIFLWLVILTIVMIALGSRMGKRFTLLQSLSHEMSKETSFPKHFCTREFIWPLTLRIWAKQRIALNIFGLIHFHKDNFFYKKVTIHIVQATVNK